MQVTHTLNAIKDRFDEQNIVLLGHPPLVLICAPLKTSGDSLFEWSMEIECSTHHL